MLEVDCGSGRRWFENIKWDVRCVGCYSTMTFSFSELNWVIDNGSVTLYIYCPCCGKLHVSYENDPASELCNGEFRHLSRTGNPLLWGVSKIWINDTDRRAFAVAFPERGRRR